MVWRMVKEVRPEQKTEDLVEAERRASGNSQAD